jgi:class 3 adenylate cyclase
MPTEILDQRLEAIAERKRFTAAQLRRFGRYVREAPDEALLHVNPLRFAIEQGMDERDAVDLFVHAAHAGVFDLLWGIVCEHCAGYLTTAGGIRSIGRSRSCGLCAADVHGSMDDSVEVTFTVSPATRRIRFHARRAPSREDVMRVYFSPSVTLSPEFRRWIDTSWLGVRRVAGGRKTSFALELPPGDYAVITNENHTRMTIRVGASGGRTVEVDLLEARFVPAAANARAGRIVVRVTNRDSAAASLVFARLPGDDDLNGKDPFYSIGPFLTGKRLLSTQSYRELFRGETPGRGASLAIRSLCFLFTDLKSSTALYERVGDIKALAMVRDHFGILRDRVSANGGAVVKTIGDAVMATFDEPRAGMAAALQMNAALRSKTRTRELSVKVGLHVGPCVAIDSNDRLDYFGQTVNIAARVQALADGGEVVCTDAVWNAPGTRTRPGGSPLRGRRELARLKGVAGNVPVTRIRA